MSDNELGLLSYGQTRVLVDDFATSFRFYRDVLGLPLKDDPADAPRAEDGPYACFAIQGNDLALFTRAYQDAAIGAPHRERDGVDGVVIVLRVADVDAAAKAAVARGAELVSEPADQPAWGMRVAHLRAPEGTLIELCHYDD
ncbi:VOC family protein [Nocardia yamanashiensis]|uniref:VOC family protein n=1 Tax=Nocardia yamanashiensis TaxID=209247 RepID=UPI001E32D987|nr:VOC family protein [Nocardia yamanashiensis]UGT43085.1 VOC family protein [Nocardia yamanashiensis]